LPSNTAPVEGQFESLCVFVAVVRFAVAFSSPSNVITTPSNEFAALF
jgi:hypothetical protein